MVLSASALLSIIALTASIQTVQLRRVGTTVLLDASKAEAVKMAKAVGEAAAEESLPDKVAGGGTKSPSSKLVDDLANKGQAIHEQGLFSESPNHGDMQRITDLFKIKKKNELADSKSFRSFLVAGGTENLEGLEGGEEDAWGDEEEEEDEEGEESQNEEETADEWTNGDENEEDEDKNEEDEDKNEEDKDEFGTDEGTDAEIEEILRHVTWHKQHNKRPTSSEMGKKRPTSRRSNSPRSPVQSLLARKLQKISNNKDWDELVQAGADARSQGIRSNEEATPESGSLFEDEKLIQLLRKKFWPKGLELDEKDQEFVNQASTLINNWKEMSPVEQRDAGKATSPRKAMQSPVKGIRAKAAVEALREQDLVAMEALPQAWELDLEAKTEAEAAKGRPAPQPVISTP